MRNVTDITDYMDNLPVTMRVKASTYKRLVNIADLFDTTVNDVLERLILRKLSSDEGQKR